MTEQTIEQKIKDYLYFHLSKENRNTLTTYLNYGNHYDINVSKDKILPVTFLVPVLTSQLSKIEEGELYDSKKLKEDLLKGINVVTL